MSLALSHEELSEITGYKTKSKQADWLTRNGWTFHLNRFNRPIVSLDYYKLRSGASNSAAVLTTEPNWQALGL